MFCTTIRQNLLNKLKYFRNFCSDSAKANTAYVQGQSPEPKIREYFYYIDHEGMVL